MNKKTKNIITAVIIGVMVVAAGAVLAISLGLPKIKLGPDEEKILEERHESQKGILGEWTDPDDPTFVIDVWKDAKGGFHAIINKSDNDGEVIYWEMDGVWQDFENGFFYSTCKKSIAKYDMDGNLTETVVYEDGSGSISAVNGGVVWEDKKEKMGDGITFEYTGEY